MPILTIWDMADRCGNVTVIQVAEYYGVHPNTARKWIDNDLIAHRHTPSGRRIIIKASDVERFDAAYRHAQPSIR
jgi:excisionase family DNA binding protein